jgi:hypothetical protein
MTACSDDRGGETSVATTTSTTTTLLRVPAVSFTEDGPPVDLGDGWSVIGCEGDAPLICVDRDGARVGVIELATFPVESFALPGFREAAARGDVDAAMRILADDFITTFERDRREGCGDAYRIEAEEPETSTVLGQAGLRYGYVARQDGAIVERQLNHGTIVGSEVVLANAPAYAAGGCVPREGEFEPSVLDEFEPYLRALIVTASR